MEEIKRHQFFSTIDWNVSVSAHQTALFARFCLGCLTLPVCSCRNSSAERSTLPSSRQRADPTTRSTSTPSSRPKHPEVLTDAAHATLTVTTFRVKCDLCGALRFSSCFLCVCQTRQGFRPAPTPISCSEDSVLWP